jgi:hypothetical protein
LASSSHTRARYLEKKTPSLSLCRLCLRRRSFSRQKNPAALPAHLHRLSSLSLSLIFLSHVEALYFYRQPSFFLARCFCSSSCARVHLLCSSGARSASSSSRPCVAPSRAHLSAMACPLFFLGLRAVLPWHPPCSPLCSPAGSPASVTLHAQRPGSSPSHSPGFWLPARTLCSTALSPSPAESPADSIHGVLLLFLSLVFSLLDPSSLPSHPYSSMAASSLCCLLRRAPSPQPRSPPCRVPAELLRTAPCRGFPFLRAVALLLALRARSSAPARSRFLGSPWSLRARFCPVRVLLGRPRDTSSMAAIRRRVPTCAPAPCVAFHSPKPEFASRPCLSVCCCSSLDLAQVAAMVIRCLARADSRSLISPS